MFKCDREFDDLHSSPLFCVLAWLKAYKRVNNVSVIKKIQAEILLYLILIIDTE
jgi:hypothetical protein